MDTVEMRAAVRCADVALLVGRSDICRYLAHESGQVSQISQPCVDDVVRYLGVVVYEHFLKPTALRIESARSAGRTWRSPKSRIASPLSSGGPHGSAEQMC